MKELNVVLAGVGGQGTLIAGKLFGLIAARFGMDVKVSEVHGMAQRGGSVVTYVRISDRVFSPVIEPGKADFLLAFEELEGMRWSHLLKKGGSLLINTNRTTPITVAMGQAEYPDNIVEAISELADQDTGIYAFDALKLADQAGSVRAVNFVMIGALSKLTDLDPEVFTTAIRDLFFKKNPKFVEINQRAFELGSAIIDVK